MEMTDSCAQRSWIFLSAPLPSLSSAISGWQRCSLTADSIILCSHQEIWSFFFVEHLPRLRSPHSRARQKAELDLNPWGGERQWIKRSFLRIIRNGTSIKTNGTAAKAEELGSTVLSNRAIIPSNDVPCIEELSVLERIESGFSSVTFAILVQFPLSVCRKSILESPVRN